MKLSGSLSPPGRANVLVTDGEARSTVAICRSLEAAGYGVGVAASARPAAAQWSRACTERLVLSDPLRDEAAFVEGLERIARAAPYSLLLAGSDVSLRAISRNRARLETHVRLHLPPDDVVARGLSKRWLVEHAKRAGLAVPRTVVCASAADAVAAANALGFPLLVKSCDVLFRLNGTLCRRGSVMVHDFDRLLAELPRYGSPCLVQAADRGDVYSYGGLIADGSLVQRILSRYRRMWYPEAGNVAFSETVAVPGELTEAVEALLSLLGWEGMFELELIGRPDGTFAVIDLNPRPYGSLALAVGAGADLPAAWCAAALGHPPARAEARPGVRYRWEDGDAKHLGWQLAHGHPLRAAAVLVPRRRVVHAHFRTRDPGPLIARALFLVRLRFARSRAASPVVAEQRIPSPGPREVRRRRRPARSVTILGAGPYGLAAAAHLREARVDVRLFGELMSFWHRHMPRGMLLRSRKRSSNISDPRRAFTIDDFERSEQRQVTTPSLTLAEFLDYAHWFQREAVPDVDTRKVERVDLAPEGYRLTLSDGETVSSGHVLVAAGLEPFASRPEPFQGLPRSLVSHAADHDDLSAFAGRKVLVVGAGQSALESAALLHEEGAEVDLVARIEAVRWLAGENGVPPRLSFPLPPTDVGGRVTGWLAAAPDAFRRLPARLQPEVSFRCIRPAGAAWLKPRLERVTIATGRRPVSAAADGAGIRVELDDGSRRLVDHVLLGTGYAVDVRRYPFLSEEIRERLEVRAGYPRLRAGLESSLPGLHFLGAPAALSFGPIMRFVVGTWYAAPAVTTRLLARSQPPLRFSF